MGIKIIATNKKAYHDFFIDDTYEAGIVLKGTEVKSLRLGKVNIKESFCRIIKGEVYINNMNISTYEQGNRENHDPLRSRKLLLHRTELDRLIGAVERKGHALVPLDLHWSKGRAKLLVGLARGKKQHDKRATAKDRDWQRQKARILKR
mgnify:CR=1 FL=1